MRAPRRPFDFPLGEKPPRLRWRLVLTVLATDLFGAAPTGTGKTLAFGLPVLNYLLSRPHLLAAPDGPLCLILEPTRELALQVRDHLVAVTKLTGRFAEVFCII